MTTTTRTPWRGTRARPVARDTVSVEVLICGSPDRADDGAPAAAMRLLEPSPDATVRITRIGQLDVDHLLGVPQGSGVVIVDAATGIDPGAILELPLRALVGIEDTVQPRSTHALAMPEVIGLADMLRGRPLIGRIVVIGARRFTLGRPMTRRVAAALPSLARAVGTAVEQVTEALQRERDANGAEGR